MSKIAAFGIPVFTTKGQSKNPPTIVQELNKKLEQLDITADDVVTIQVEQDFYHVFYKTKE